MYKLHTIRKTGNYVRNGAFLVLFVLVLISCEKLSDNPVDPRDNIVDTWKCVETSQAFGGQTTYSVDVSKDSKDSTKVWLDNFYNLNGFKIYAKISGLNFTIPVQTVDGNVINGSGVVSANYKTINWTYKVNYGSGIDNVTAVYTRY